ncbi:hypothetical protein EVAR_18853_1 [Eumeta japonica]|uniref:Uncharacterized protein n=1 Tax=Eumeta variegata TaxID=151549 RepID=A0A4C1UN12_EUMVA|nr:hypothetical protein EVAR_18853_1 [Eumeta japonica]
MSSLRKNFFSEIIRYKTSSYTFGVNRRYVYAAPVASLADIPRTPSAPRNGLTDARQICRWKCNFVAGTPQRVKSKSFSHSSGATHARAAADVCAGLALYNASKLPYT